MNFAQLTNSGLLPLLLVTGGPLLILIGLILLRRSAHGHPIHAHPVCAKCGFDLVGIYRTPASTGNCSECGVDFADTRNVIYGKLARRRGLWIFAWIVLFSGTGTAGIAILRTALRVPWWSLAPTKTLLTQLAVQPQANWPQANWPQANLQIVELTTRLRESPSTELALQLLRAIPTGPGFAGFSGQIDDLAETLASEGKIDRDEIANYYYELAGLDTLQLTCTNPVIGPAAQVEVSWAMGSVPSQRGNGWTFEVNVLRAELLNDAGQVAHTLRPLSLQNPSWSIQQLPSFRRLRFPLRTIAVGSARLNGPSIPTGNYRLRVRADVSIKSRQGKLSKTESRDWTIPITVQQASELDSLKRSVIQTGGGR
jgi:hypothetical protein